LIFSGVLAYGFYHFFEEPIRSKKPFAVIIEETLIQRGWRVPGWLKRHARLARRTPIEKMFSTVGELLRAWGKQPSLNHTPSEQVAQLSVLVPEIAVYADVLLDEYQRSIYSQFPADMSRARRAAEDLRANGYRAWMSRRSNRTN